MTGTLLWAVYFLMGLALKVPFDISNILLINHSLFLVVTITSIYMLLKLFFKVYMHPFWTVRFMLLMYSERQDSSIRIWWIIGSLTTGFAFTGTPFVVLVSMLEQSVFFSESDIFVEQIVIPYAITALVVLILSLVPDLFGARRRRQHWLNMIQQQDQYQSLFEHNTEAVFA